MILAKQQEMFDQFTEKQKELMFRKGNDYSNEDRLSNFKLVGSILNMSPVLFCASHIANKSVRLGNLLGSNKTPNNEAIEDTLWDIANYAQLLNMLINEEI